MGGLNYISLAIGCLSRLFIFLQQLPTIFFSLFILFIFSFSLQLSNFLSFPIKTSASPPFFIFSQFENLLLFQTLSSSLMATKTKKTSYLIFGKVLNLTRWVGATRLTKSPPLLYRPQNYLSDNAQTRLVSFSNFSHFQVLL